MGYPEIYHISLAGVVIIECALRKNSHRLLLKYIGRDGTELYLSCLQALRVLEVIHKPQILGCRLTGKDTALIRRRSRIIPEWPNKYRGWVWYVQKFNWYSRCNKGSSRYTGRRLGTCVDIILYWDFV